MPETFREKIDRSNLGFMLTKTYVIALACGVLVLVAFKSFAYLDSNPPTFVRTAVYGALVVVGILEMTVFGIRYRSWKQRNVKHA